MRSLILAFLGILAPWAIAAELTLPLIPETLDQWSLSGADEERFIGNSVTLPAGAQVSRAFAADRLSVRIATSPVFALESADWAVVELGAAAVIFAREGTAGYLVLALGEQEMAIHPHEIALDAEGRSAGPLNATLLQHDGYVSLESAGQRIELVAPAEQALGVVASAGATHAWSLDGFTVTLGVSDEDLVPEPGHDRKGSESTSAAALNERKSAMARGERSAGTSRDGDALRGQRSALPDGYRPLEIYTPPAVRTHRAEQIKAAIKALRTL